MSRFPTAAHLASWAKLSPRTIQSGARSRGGKTGKGNPYLKGILGEAAAAAAKTGTFLGERYRRIVKRRGKLRALVAVARSILVIISGTCSPIPPPLHRPRRRLLRQPDQQQPQSPQPHSPARSPRLHRHPHRRLTRRPTTGGPPAGSADAAARPAKVRISGQSLRPRAGTPRRRENPLVTCGSRSCWGACRSCRARGSFGLRGGCAVFGLRWAACRRCYGERVTRRRRVLLGTLRPSVSQASGPLARRAEDCRFEHAG